ncbi:MAG: lytic transglycosylase domain-containing protein [Longimicrobiales bacterium]
MRRTGILEDFEQVCRRAKVVVFVAPLLLFVGFGAGNMTNRALELPDGDELRAGGTADVPRVKLEALSRHMEKLRSDGEHTAEYVSLYNELIAPIERVLRRRGVTEEMARRVAWPLVEQSYRNALDPATVLSIMLVESNGLPSATSSVGARGLMQVMPSWSGHYRSCGNNLYDIEDNLCYGTNILAWYLRRFDGDERRALLGYNGCVHGTNTPNCHTYPDKVARLRRQISQEIAIAKVRSSFAGAASP